MGYTHYWYRPATFPAKDFARYASDLKALLAALPSGIVICDGDGEGEPDITPEVVNFNGTRVSNLWHESFTVQRQDTSTWPGRPAVRREGVRDLLWWEFCKTAHKPYDLLVTAALIAMAYRFPACVISSDGDADDWQPGLNLWRSVFPGHATPMGLWLPDYQKPRLYQTGKGAQQ